MQKLVVEQQATVIMITHDMEVVAQYADRVIVIDAGKVVLEGEPKDVFFLNYDKLHALKLKPPIISQFASQLSTIGFPPVLNWNMFNQKIIQTYRTTKII